MSTFGFKIEHGLGKSIDFDLPEMNDYNPCSMFNLQREAFDKVHNKDFFVVKMPTGSGKSTVASFIIGEDLTNNPNKKAIITVPQLSIAKSFRHKVKGKYTKFIYENPEKKDMNLYEFNKWVDSLPEEKKVDWTAGVDLTNEELSIKSTVKSFIDFVKSKGTTVSSRICLCTHQTLVAAFRKMEEDENLHLFRDIKTIIDEYHHVEDNDKQGLGEFVSFVFKNYGKNKLGLGLFSATPFRGDLRRIIPLDFESLFQDSTYLLPFDRYMKEMRFLRCFDYRFGCYKVENGTSEVISNCLKENQYKKNMIFLPRRTPGDSIFSPKHKNKEVKEIVKGIALSYGWDGPIVQRTKDLGKNSTSAIFEIQVGEDKFITIVDLVDNKEHIRKSVKKHLNTINDDPNFADYIITLEIGKEGFDWKHCDQVIILGKIGSLTQLVQMVGRALRDVDGKEKARVSQFFPISSDILDNEEEVLDNLNDVINAVSLSMLMYEVMEPIDIAIPNPKNNKEEIVHGADLLNDIFKNEDKCRDFTNEVQSLISDLQSEKGTDISFEERQDIVKRVMREMGIEQKVIETYSNPLTKYLRIRSERVMPSILLSLEGSKILSELRDKFRFVSSIPSESFVAAFAADQMYYGTLGRYHEAMDRLNGREAEKISKQNIEKMKKFLEKSGGRLPDEDSEDKEEAELGKWLNLARTRKCHRHQNEARKKVEVNNV